MKFYDVSMTIHPEMPVWKGYDHKRPIFTITRDFDADGTGGRETKLAIDMHTGTHIDAPLHFLAHGDSIEKTKITELVRRVKVLDLTDVVEKITGDDLRKFAIEKSDFILLKTKNSFEEEFNQEFVYLDYTGARYLVEQAITGVGIDSLGIERAQTDYATHKQLLAEKIIIIEGLRLAQVDQGDYFMVAAPLKLVGVEAAPARVLLFENDLN